MNDASIEDDWLEDGQSGHLTAAARHAATIEALPLLATYFASGADTLVHDQVLSREAQDELGDLLEFVQIRVLLAAADRLEPIARAVLDRPSFRYHQVREESVGVIRGRLDTIAYLRRRHEVQAPRRFPVRNVMRSYVLPENVLAAWAVLSVAGMLKRLPLQRLPAEAPERQRAERSTESLRRLARQPALSDAVHAAEAVWRAGTHLTLLDRVRSRLRAGYVPNAEHYEALTGWVETFDAKNIALHEGEVDWLFYDESFDTKLFELWCLYRLVRALTARIGEPHASRLLVERKQNPIAEWSIGDVHIEVWFQAGLATIKVGEPRWTYDPRPRDGERPADESEPSGKFGGVPDITVVVSEPGQGRRAIILDPKLRQRPSVPGAEIYRIVGYLANLPAGNAARGGIIFHGPDHQRSYRITDGSIGEVLAVAVDPLQPRGSDIRFLDLADFVITSVPRSTMTRATGPENPDNDASVEAWVDTVQEQIVDEMTIAITPQGLEHAKKQLRSNLLEVWDRVDEGTQRMLATAEWFGAEATADMDHSGPLLGLAAGCERILRQFVAGLGLTLVQRTTFGQMLHQFEDACLGRYNGRPLRQALTSRGVDLDQLRPLISDLFKLNARYRIPAAHADVLEEARYLEGRAEILIGPKAALPSIVRVLHL